MSITLEQIDELRKRANVSYKDAREALEKSGGDILEALVYLESNNKTGPSNGQCAKKSFTEKINELIKKGNRTRCVMRKQEKTIFSLSMNMVILIALISLPFIEFLLLGLLIALFTGHRIRIEKDGGEYSKTNEALDKLCNAVDHVKKEFAGGNAGNAGEAKE